MSDTATVRRPLTPGRIFRAIQSRILDRLQPLNAFRGVYTTFDEAQRGTPNVKPLGYDHADSATWYTTKFAELQLEDYPVVFWMSRALADSRSVFEIGGHVGVAFYGFGRVLPFPADLSWTILDVPSIAAAGQKLARERNETRLRFAGGYADVTSADILLAAGSLQYIESPSLAETISGLREKPKHVFVNHTPVYDGPSFVTVQNIGTAYCPYRVFNRAELVASVERLGYRLIDSWKKPRRFEVRFHAERSFDHYTGLYFARSDVAAVSTNP